MKLLLRSVGSSFAGLLASTTLLSSCAPASAVASSRLYDVTIETGMPHLEENLRYAITRQQRCLSHAELFSVFPILTQASLQGCQLGDEHRRGNTSSWTLVCEGAPGATGGTTGHALWILDAPRITGTLNVKLGGKNMTFYQRATLMPLGECNAGSR